ncbi:MAG: IS110 family transposase [Actinobacteria bacterium]|nr:IS110 family transposase [Actinomycetota bacterium]
MEIVGAMDLHRRQITFKWQDLSTGEIKRGRIMPAARAAVREWLSQFEGRDAHVVLEATTGWRFVVEEMQRIGVTPHLAEPAETSLRRGPKRRAKTDDKDCDLMVDLLLQGRVPESWIPPEHILELRARVRLRKALLDERRVWQQRVQAQLYHQGIAPGSGLSTAKGRARLAEAELSSAGRQLITVGIAMLDACDLQMFPLDAHLISFAKAQPGCRALMGLFGVGHLTSATILAELGDCRRFSNSDDAVRYSGPDITVYESNGKRPPGHLSRQGPEVLRWALYEAAQSGARRTSPDHAYYLETRDRIDHNRACLAIARKLCRRAHHILKELGVAALQPVEVDIDPATASTGRVEVAA